jgi:hypothetical protein
MDKRTNLETDQPLKHDQGKQRNYFFTKPTGNWDEEREPEKKIFRFFLKLPSSRSLPLIIYFSFSFLYSALIGLGKGKNPTACAGIVKLDGERVLGSARHDEILETRGGEAAGSDGPAG